MALFAGNKGEEVTVSGHKLVCPVCGGEDFIHRRTQLNTAGLPFF